MLNVNDFLLALNDVEDEYIEETAKSMGYLMKNVSRPVRRIGRTFLIAAIIVCLTAGSAFAVGYTVHQRRQAELSEMMKVEENSVSGYVEYEENAAGNTEPHIELLSSISDGDLYNVYLSISPISEDEARKAIENVFTLSAHGLVYFAGNSDPPPDENKSMAHPVYVPVEEESEHQTEVTDPNGNTFMHTDMDWMCGQMYEQSYDPETQSLMVECKVHKSYADWDKPVYLGVKMVDFSVLTEDGRLDCVGGLLRDFGTVRLRFEETDEIVFDFTDEPFAIENPDGGSGNILSVTVRATGAEWRMKHDNMEECYALSSLNLEGDEFHRAFEIQLSWINYIDRIMNNAYLTMDDGSTFPLMGSNSAPYKDGVVTMYSDWDGTIDISRVMSITVNGETRTL